MKKSGLVLARWTLALAFGVVWGFFIAFNVVFFDVFLLWEMVWATAFVFAAYLILGAVFGVIGYCTGVRWTWGLAAPGVVFVGLGLRDDPVRVLYHVAVIVALVAGSAIGTWAGARVRGGVVRKCGVSGEPSGPSGATP